MHDTDATGAIYFTAAPRFALEAFEEVMRKEKFYFEKEGFALPIVRSEVNYSLPLTYGDETKITLSCNSQGTSSFTLAFEFTKEGEPCADVMITFVVIDKKTHKKQRVPKQLAHLLEDL